MKFQYRLLFLPVSQEYKCNHPFATIIELFTTNLLLIPYPKP